MKTALIALLLTLFSVTALAETTDLRFEPNSEARLLSTDANTSDLYIIEKTGEWSRVVNTKTGLVGWAKMPNITVDEIVPDEEQEDDSSIVDEEDENDIRGMVLALI